MRVLIGCESSGRTREAFRARGHDVISCDLLPSEDGSLHHIVGDVFDVIRDYGPFDLLVGHPPCTFLANSGARWLWQNGKRDLDSLNVDLARWSAMRQGAEFFAALLDAPIDRIAIENPVMHSYARAAIAKAMDGVVYQTHFVQPWWFGDPAFKATGFTLKGLRPLSKPIAALTPPKAGTDEHKAWSAVHRASPSPTRWKDRSRTFPGIAQAMAETWG